MAKSTSAKEARVKARSTSLSKKSVEELVNIILRKDNTERSNSVKINNLKQECLNLSETVEQLEEKIKIGITPYEETIETLKDRISSQNEVIDERNATINEINAKCERLKYLAKFRRKAVYSLAIIYVITVVLLLIY